MEQLLFIDACVRGERSRTRKLAEHFLKTYQDKHPDTAVVRAGSVSPEAGAPVPGGARPAGRPVGGRPAGPAHV